MNSPYVTEAVATLTNWPQEHIRVVQQLGDGPTNETWQVAVTKPELALTSGQYEQHFVLRLTKALARKLGLSLIDEIEIVHAISKHQLAAPIIASNVKHGMVLSAYLPGRSWGSGDLNDLNNLTRLAHTVRRLHRVTCSTHSVGLAGVIEAYAQRSNDSRARAWADAALTELAHVTSREPVLCHNDLTAPNIIDDGVGGLHLIDWEFAALGDPLFDLAVVVAHHDLDATLAAHFLAAYLDGNEDNTAMDDNFAADLIRWSVIYANLLALWQSLFEHQTVS